ncbi:gephyrin-like molybdotransferase Glp [Leptothermofonsia sp. ETS-13]|uniref:molybdopterin molybdotransferase MoeA n=1 Tax=Leptothermofonsia sp. ETS-13 TaxID=3035696 RepID=UPI003BA35E52
MTILLRTVKFGHKSGVLPIPSMLSVAQAENIILNQVHPFNPVHDSEILDLLDAIGRILAKPVTSGLDFPHWDNSAMDGYAVRFEDVQFCSPEQPVTLEIVEEIPAGYQPQRRLQAGEAARILTGSVMPAGADTVVIQEETQREGSTVTILAAPKPGAFVRQRGSFYQSGAPLLPVGLRLQAPEIAVLAAAQCAQVRVYRQPRVAILSTGNELVRIDQPLQPGQIVDSNQYALAALVAQTGAIPIRMGVVPDEPEALKQAMAKAIATADIVLSSGGVSVGDYDYVETILESLGGDIHIRAIAVKPGKPLTVATFGHQEPGVRSQESGARDGEARGQGAPATIQAPILNSRSKIYFGLPGNPVSALVTFWRFVQPALRKLSGLPQSDWGPTFLAAKSRTELRSDGKRESYLWGRFYLTNGQYEFDLASGSHSSGNLINLAGTNGLAVLPVGQTQIAAGETVQVMVIR